MTGEQEPIEQRFIKALAHPLRVTILNQMATGAISPNGLSEELNKPLSNVAYHVRVLKECGAIELVDEKRRRGAIEHFFRARPDAFIGAEHWRRVPEGLRTSSASLSFARLADKTIAAVDSGSFARHDESELTWQLITVDGKGWGELRSILKGIPESVRQVHERSVARLGPETGDTVVVAILAFEDANKAAEGPT